MPKKKSKDTIENIDQPTPQDIAFSAALAYVQATHALVPVKTIGRLNEHTLHAVLKHYIEPDSTCHEVKVDGLVADIVNADGITEIQTRSFSSLVPKLERLLPLHKVTVVYPIAAVKWLHWVDKDTGEVTPAHRSPRRGRLQDIFYELYRIRAYLEHKNFRLCVMFLDIDEYRYLNGWSTDKKKGSERANRVPRRLAGRTDFICASDYAQLLPQGMTAENFSLADFKKQCGVSLNNARMGLKLLERLGIVQRTGKKGNAVLYSVK